MDGPPFVPPWQGGRLWGGRRGPRIEHPGLSSSVPDGTCVTHEGRRYVVVSLALHARIVRSLTVAARIARSMTVAVLIGAFVPSDGYDLTTFRGAGLTLAVALRVSTTSLAWRTIQS